MTWKGSSSLSAYKWAALQSISYPFQTSDPCQDQKLPMTEDQMREAMLEDAKAIRKRTQSRDGQTQSLKQNMALDYNMGGRDAKPETKEIIDLANKGVDRDTICRRMSFKGYSRRKTLDTLVRHSDKIK